MTINTELFDQIIRDTIAENIGATSEEIADAAISAGVFDDEWRAQAERAYARVEARRRVKDVRDANGMPVYFTTAPKTDDGAPTYKPIPLFDLTDYEVAARPYRRGLEHAIAVLQHLRSAAAENGVHLQLPLWIPEPVHA